MKFEQVLPALRRGERVWHPGLGVGWLVAVAGLVRYRWGRRGFEKDVLIGDQMLDDQWEVMEREPEQVAESLPGP